MGMNRKLCVALAFGAAIGASGAAQANYCSTHPGANSVACSDLNPGNVVADVLAAVDSPLSDFKTLIKSLTITNLGALEGLAKAGKDTFTVNLPVYLTGTLDSGKVTKASGSVEVKFDFKLNKNGKGVVKSVTDSDFYLADTIKYTLESGSGKHAISSLVVATGNKTFSTPAFNVSVPGPIAGAGLPTLAAFGAWFSLRRRKTPSNA